MNRITRSQVRDLTAAALDNAKKGDTIHLSGSGHGRYIVGGIGTSIVLPPYQANHPATTAFVTDRLNAMLADFPRAETVGSWRDIVTGNVYFDLGTTHEKRDTAVYIAGVRSERAIYDATAETVEWTERPKVEARR